MAFFIDWFSSKMCYLSFDEIVERRTELFRVIDGDAFFSMKEWPESLKRVFWKKPTSDSDSFKLILFLIGNGLEPKLAAEWIMLSQYWSRDQEKMKKRARQMDFIIANLQAKKSEWFYFDIYHGRLVLLNGTFKQ